MPPSSGSKAFKDRGTEWAAQRKTRQARAAAQKRAREALAYPDAPRGLTREALAEQHRRMREDFYRRMGERRPA